MDIVFIVISYIALSDTESLESLHFCRVGSRFGSDLAAPLEQSLTLISTVIPIRDRKQTLHHNSTMLDRSVHRIVSTNGTRLALHPICVPFQKEQTSFQGGYGFYTSLVHHLESEP